MESWTPEKIVVITRQASAEVDLLDRGMQTVRLTSVFEVCREAGFRAKWMIMCVCFSDVSIRCVPTVHL